MQTIERQTIDRQRTRQDDRQRTRQDDRPPSGRIERAQVARPYLYFAYGSNLNQEQMGWRCPSAQPVSRLTLADWRLEFRGVADIVPCPGAEVVGALYSICAGDELALDRYEGFRRQSPDAGMYRKVFRTILDQQARKRTIMFYVMNRAGLWPPYEGYLETIRQGYTDWALPTDTLETAAQRSYPTWPEEEEWNAGRNEEDALTGDLFE